MLFKYKVGFLFSRQNTLHAVGVMRHRPEELIHICVDIVHKIVIPGIKSLSLSYYTSTKFENCLFIWSFLPKFGVLTRSVKKLITNGFPSTCSAPVRHLSGTCETYERTN